MLNLSPHGIVEQIREKLLEDKILLFRKIAPGLPRAVEVALYEELLEQNARVCIHPAPQTLNPNPSILNPKPNSLNPKP